MSRAAERESIYQDINEIAGDYAGRGLQMVLLRLIEETGELSAAIQDYIAHPGDSTSHRIAEEAIHVAAAAVALAETADRAGLTEERQL